MTDCWEDCTEVIALVGGARALIVEAGNATTISPENLSQTVTLLGRALAGLEAIRESVEGTALKRAA